MCYTYDKSKGGDTRELQSRMVSPKKLGRVTLKQGNEMLQRVISTAEFLQIEFDVKWLLLEDCILPRSW